MKLSDLRYITQENIDEAYINVTSPEMYAEVRDFNIHMLRMRRKRALFLADYWGMFMMNAGLVPVIVMYSLTFDNTPLLRMNAPLWVNFVLPLIFWALYAYIIFFRKIFEWGIMLGVSLILVPAGLMFLINAGANSIITFFLRRIDEDINTEAGYPGFVELRASYIRKEVREQMDVYSTTYVKPPENEDFLFDSDISSLTGNTEKNEQ